MERKLTNEQIRGLFSGSTNEIRTDEVRDLGPEVLDADERLRVLPAAYWAATAVQERALVGHRNGLYCLPTVELVAYLKDLIGDRSAIEVGAGNGVLAEALGIPATDNFQQRMPKYRYIYEASKQPIVQYGPDVVDMNASRAVRRYKPEVVIGAWITHKYDPKQHAAGGNEIGVDEQDILRHCESYVLIGNEKTHAKNPLWSKPHEIVYPSWLYSRAHNGSREFIAMWPGAARTAATGDRQGLAVP